MVILVLSHDNGEFVLSMTLVENILVCFVRSHDNVLSFHGVKLFLFIEGDKNIVKSRRKPEFRIFFIDIWNSLLSGLVMVKKIFHIWVVFVKIILKNVILKFIVELLLYGIQNILVFHMGGLQKANYLVVAGDYLLPVRLRIKFKLMHWWKWTQVDVKILWI